MRQFSSLFVLLCVFSLSAFTQISVPPEAEAHFANIYPEVENPHWEYREGGISALFTLDDELIKVFYENDGEWRETRTSVSRRSLPQSVVEFISTYYRNGRITYAGQVKTQTEVYYRIESEYLQGMIIKLLTPNGQLLKEERITYTSSLGDQFIP